MPASDFTTVLARLLSESALRAEFTSSKERVLGGFELSRGDREGLLGLDACDLELQAQALVTKRRTEVASLLPDTFALLGIERSAALFAMYAETNWPDTHRRHLEDAVKFGEYLQRVGAPVSESELNLLRFRLQGRHFSVRVIEHATAKRRMRSALQILIRIGSRQRSAILFLGI